MAVESIAFEIRGFKLLCITLSWTAVHERMMHESLNQPNKKVSHVISWAYSYSSFTAGFTTAFLFLYKRTARPHVAAKAYPKPSRILAVVTQTVHFVQLRF